MQDIAQGTHAARMRIAHNRTMIMVTHDNIELLDIRSFFC